MKLNIKINLDSDAFQHGNRDHEIGRVLSRIQDRLGRGDTSGSLLDANGGTRVATFKITQGHYPMPE